MQNNTLPALRLEPQYRDYVWGGQRLRPGQRTAEAWVIHEGNQVAGGSLGGQTLAETAAALGPALLGARAAARTGNRFPLLIKILDCAAWLSLQVHPNNEQAEQLEGPGHFGKTEAWHILEADTGAQILCGFKPSVPAQKALDSVRDGSILEYTQRVELRPGQTVFIRPGTLHALGPGLLVYEVQQTSDITYRVFDWNRPASEGRKLHIDQSLAVLDPSATGLPIDPPEFVDGAVQQLVTSAFFTLDLLTAETRPITLEPAGESFHLLTVINGSAVVRRTGWEETLQPYETVLVPASTDRYQVIPRQKAKLLLASV